MAVLLVRHGDALPPRDRDSSRVLSLRGREETRLLGLRVREAGLRPTAIVSSDFVRAVQTAELLAHVLLHEGIIEAEPALQPAGDADYCVDMLRARDAPDQLVVVVTHEPIVREIAAQLVGVRSFRPFQTSEGVLFSPAGVQVM